MNDFITEICDKAYDYTKDDADINEYAAGVRKTIEALLDLCAVFEGDDEIYLEHSSTSTRGCSITVIIIQEYMSFCGDQYGAPSGGSLADYCASAAARALEGYTLRVLPERADEFREQVIPEMREYALYPEDEIQTLEDVIAIGIA